MARGVGGALGILMMATALAGAREDGPPLVPPALEPPAESPAPATPPSPKPEGEPAPRRPFLVIPGVNTPAAPARSTREPAIEPAPNPSSSPPLAGPARATRAGSAAPTVTIPLTLEPIPEDEADAAPGVKAPAPVAPVEGGGGSRYVPGTMLGRLLGFDDGRGEAGGAISVESKADPAVDAAVKRRIEKAVRESLGDRASAVEVRVKGRSVLIRARASRFWHRRGVRRALDAFELPSGYHGRAELID